MVELKGNALKWLKTAHIFAACLWGGAATALVVVQFVLNPTTGDELHYRDLCMKIIDDFVVAPGALGCLITGIIFAVGTKWGFFRHGWIIIKWIMNIGFILFGMVYFVPWLDQAERLSDTMRLSALRNADYIHAHTMNSVVVVLQAAALLALVWLTIFKPRLSEIFEKFGLKTTKAP
ncbi:MAG: DUF2269 family protein [Desulfovibrio sp.]|uniref:DUF2269 family protein n=1 Tax=Desulfovibrio sp. 7SRBS1 TaxID=3378064 RepID=UPI003B3ECC14